MREILFRGKRADNGEWVEGYYCPRHHDDGSTTYTIRNLENCFREVLLSTVGQFTGLFATNGKRIFEGDIVLVNRIATVVCFNNYCVGENDYGAKLIFPCFAFSTIDNKAIIGVAADVVTEIVGNIHDNPELLGIN